MFLFSDGTLVPDSHSVLKRNDAGATAELTITGMPEGHAFTMWAVIFNAPEACTHPFGPSRCGPGDIGPGSPSKPSVLRVAGHITDGGEETFAGRIKMGDTSEALLGPGLTAPRDADVILVVLDHGEKDPGDVPTQIHTIMGCNPDCVDHAVSVHQA